MGGRGKRYFCLSLLLSLCSSFSFLQERRFIFAHNSTRALTKSVREMSSQLLVSQHTLSISSSAHKQLKRALFVNSPVAIIIVSWMFFIVIKLITIFSISLLFFLGGGGWKSCPDCILLFNPTKMRVEDVFGPWRHFGLTVIGLYVLYASVVESKN